MPHGQGPHSQVLHYIAQCSGASAAKYQLPCKKNLLGCTAITIECFPIITQQCSTSWYKQALLKMAYTGTKTPYDVYSHMQLNISLYLCSKFTKLNSPNVVLTIKSIEYIGNALCCQEIKKQLPLSHSTAGITYTAHLF